MFDAGEYLLSVQEQDKAILGLADSVERVLRCMKYGERQRGELNRSLADMVAYRHVYIALVEHARELLE